MNVDTFTSLLQDPGHLDAPTQTQQLEEVLVAYPWFQPARALYLKGLHQMNSYKYNPALKMAAACTADREVLFDYITSDAFLQDAIAQNLSGDMPLAETEIISESVEPNPESETEMVAREKDSPLPRSLQEADRILDPGLFRSVNPEIDEKLAAARKQAKEALELGRPLEFTRKERYSFSEWLQITSFKQKPDRTETPVHPEAKEAAHPEGEQSPLPEGESTALPKGEQSVGDAANQRDRELKFQRIERFIELNPKIVPDPKAKGSAVDIKSSVKLDKEELMTETLARVYLEQGKYKKAIQAYRILSLKYPEKSGFFADQIKAVEQLRQDKSK